MKDECGTMNEAVAGFIIQSSAFIVKED